MRCYKEVRPQRWHNWVRSKRWHNWVRPKRWHNWVRPKRWHHTFGETQEVTLYILVRPHTLHNLVRPQWNTTMRSDTGVTSYNWVRPQGDIMQLSQTTGWHHTIRSDPRGDIVQLGQTQQVTYSLVRDGDQNQVTSYNYSVRLQKWHHLIGSDHRSDII